MTYKVLKPIPGSGYQMGETGTFKADDVKELIKGEYIEQTNKDEDDKPAPNPKSKKS